MGNNKKYFCIKIIFFNRLNSFFKKKIWYECVFVMNSEYIFDIVIVFYYCNWWLCIFIIILLFFIFKYFLGMNDLLFFYVWIRCFFCDM